jgi:hypothetical protein
MRESLQREVEENIHKVSMLSATQQGQKVIQST